MELRKDIWRVFIVDASAGDIVRGGGLCGQRIVWLPGRPELSYDADPFGLWREDRLYVFVERFDYREAHGYLAVHVFDQALRWIASEDVLREPWHLSYPFLFEWQGETWMLPEASASGGLILYRAEDFPLRWVRHSSIELDATPIDATPFRWQDRWWLAYTPAGSPRERLTHLHLAWSEALEGPWTPHPANPVLVDPSGVRPGGRSLVIDGALVLPVQDCRTSYGSGMRMLTIARLDPTQFEGRLGPLWLAPDAASPFVDGFHTFGQAGGVTLIDCKQRSLSLSGLSMKPRRMVKRLLQR